jgi:hypothetical protein
MAAKAKKYTFPHKYNIRQFVVVKNFDFNDLTDCVIISKIGLAPDEKLIQYTAYHAGTKRTSTIFEHQITGLLGDPTGGDPYGEDMKLKDDKIGLTVDKKCLDVSTFKTGAVRDTAKGKAPLSQLDNELLMQMALVLEYGEQKYSRGNWRKGIPYNRCIDSLMRHIAAFKEGETHDKATGLHHLGHAACNIMFLLRYEADNRTDLDDRDKV